MAIVTVGSSGIVEIPEQDYGKITTLKALVSYILDKNNNIDLILALL